MLPQMQVAFRRPREAVDLMGSDPFITAVEGKNHGFWLRLPSVGGLTPLNQLSARAGGATTGSYSYKERRRWSALRPVYPIGSRVRARRAGHVDRPFPPGKLEGDPRATTFHSQPRWRQNPGLPED
jgi:hypothetical protein